METFLLLVGIFALITLFLPWINHARFGQLKNEISELKIKIKHLEDASVPASLKKKAEKPEAKEEKTDALKEFFKTEDRTEPTTTKKPKSSAPLTSSNDWVKTAQESFEKNIATKLPVWIGAISLICAAFFLVKYSLELGWMQPMVRVSLGGLFGLSLLTAGQWVIKRPNIANSKRISQGLVGAGLVALYVSIYAALNLYSLLPAIIGFGAMTAITALAVILSLKHGQPIAVFGLLGGLLTPALVGSDEPNAIAMFSYLFLLFTGMFTVLVRKGWWILAVIAVIGVFMWSGLWFWIAFAATDAIVLVVFAIAVAAVILAVTGKKIAEEKVAKDEKTPLHALNFAAMFCGFATIAWLSFEVSLTLFDWSTLGLLSLAMMTLSYFQPKIYLRPLCVKLAASLILFFFWSKSAPLTDAVAVLLGLSAVYIGGGAFLMRQVKDPRFWAGLQAIAVIALYLIGYLTFDLPERFTNAFGMFWGITSLVLASLAIYQAADIRQKYKADNKIQEHLVAIFALLASSLISTGLAIELPWNYLPLAIAAQTAVTALIYNRTGIEFLKQISIILTLIFAGLHYDQITMFLDIAEAGISGHAPHISTINRYVLDAPFIILGIPSLLFALTFWVFSKNKNQNQTLDHVIFGTAVICAAMTSYYLFKYLGHGDYAVALSTQTGFIERGLISVVIALIGFSLLNSLKRFNIAHLTPWAIGFLILAGMRYVFFDLMIHNPYWNYGQNVGKIPFLNGVTLTYGGAAILCAWAVHTQDLKANKTFYKVLGFISLFAFASLLVRQYFHGTELIKGEMIPAELYGYSLAWLLTGIGLLTAGIAKENKTARMASLAFIVIAVVKVFLFDASELEGLYRVFSFLGLGVSLIGLSYFYSKFVFKNEAHN